MGNHTKNWDVFRETGLFTFVNVFLQIFGWSIILEINGNGKVKSVYPDRVTYNGFPEESMTKAFLKVKKTIGIYEEEETEDDCCTEEIEDDELSEEEMRLQASINSNPSSSEELKNILDKIEEFKKGKLAEEKLYESREFKSRA